MPRVNVPDNIRALVEENQIGNAKRNDAERARAAMEALGISHESEFFVFCSEFCLGNLISCSSNESLVDVCDPNEEVAVGTQFATEVWGLSPEYVCFTSCQGEGGYLYSNVTEAVYDFSLSEREEFLAKKVPRWPSFYSFLAWYLSKEAEQ